MSNSPAERPAFARWNSKTDTADISTAFQYIALAFQMQRWNEYPVRIVINFEVNLSL